VQNGSDVELSLCDRYFDPRPARTALHPIHIPETLESPVEHDAFQFSNNLDSAVAGLTRELARQKEIHFTMKFMKEMKIIHGVSE
jgi:hypothetical protein